ncbi:unnamed protein product, partial [Candidula unifasciata]
ITTSQAADWSYSGSAGPLYWHELFPEDCSGKYQSPIDIHPEETVYNPELKDFAIWYDPPKKDSKMYIRNNGHTVQVDLEGDFYVSNAGLSSVYKAVQFHFHWGHKAHHGSEHLIDGKPSPIELHLVTYNSQLYPSISEAVMEEGGLAVLGVMYEISETDNPSLATLVKALRHVRDPEKQQRAPLPLMSLRDFLPKDISRYYRYNGSLTTPGCFESVIWTVFDTKQTISHKQLKEFTTVLQFQHKEKGDHSRHRRSLTKEERVKERRAKGVLDELGIRNSLTFTYTRLTSLGDQFIFSPVAGKEVVKDTYIQETIVNNFRPVQPLNDRIVYRSFKHVCVVAPPDVPAKWSPPSEASKDNWQGDKNSCARFQSLPIVVISLVLTIRWLHV